MRTVGVVTVARSDYGIYVPVLRRMREESKLCLRLFVSGAHLSPEFGFTVRDIEKDGFAVDERVEMLLSSDSPESIAKSMGLGTLGFAQAYRCQRPDILLVLGDRFEMHAAVVAAIPFKIPVAHIHGGESTEGAFDECLRHSITKMSHLHFVATEFYGRRVVQMGEEPWRVIVSGAPGLDNICRFICPSRAEVETKYGVKLDAPTLLVTYHPVTLEYSQTERQVSELLAALRETGCRIVLTYPNADTCSRVIIEKIREFAREYHKAQVVVNLGTQGYFSLMNHAAAMVGNSSSGIVEAASFKLPVVNVGNRQRGRYHERNVIDVGYNRADILEGLRKVLSPDFRASLKDLVNPYGDGRAAERIVETVARVPLDERLLVKRFYDGSGDREASDKFRISVAREPRSH